MTEKEILDAVQNLLKDYQPPDYRIEMSRDGVRHDGRWWYIVVHPSDPEVRASEYTRRLEDIETKIAKEHGVNVLLVPTIED